MSTGEDPTTRVGNDERQAAIAVLGEHWRAGRLDPTEHERRTTVAYSATTRGDLDALFTDLPSGWDPGATGAPGAGLAVGSMSQAPTAPTGDGRGGLFPDGSWAAQHRDALMGVAPFAALALFFITKQWWMFLLIPVMGVVLYAGDGDSRGRRARNQARDERRRIERGE